MSWVLACWECEQGKSSQVFSSDQRNLFGKKKVILPRFHVKVNQVLSLGWENDTSWWVVNIFVFFRDMFWPFCCLWLGCDRKELFFRYFCERCILASINIFSCIDNNLQVSFIRSTRWHEQTCWDWVLQQLCCGEVVKVVRVSMWHICEKLLVERVLCLLFFVMSWSYS